MHLRTANIFMGFKVVVPGLALCVFDFQCFYIRTHDLGENPIELDFFKSHIKLITTD